MTGVRRGCDGHKGQMMYIKGIKPPSVPPNTLHLSLEVLSFSTKCFRLRFTSRGRSAVSPNLTLPWG